MSDAAPAGKRTFVVVPHTHWDREWYLPFEAFRARLLRMMDALLDLLDRDREYKHFVLDGQTIPLDDYLEVRPERRADIERLVKAGRLLVGPGYVLPDEFLIGGESHVRNLQFGIRSAEAYGGAMMVGYSPDAFGHIAHLPAVLRGFGIDTVAIWRGVGREATTSEFRWASPDGSEVLALHFPFGYGMLQRLPEDRNGLANALANIRTMLEPFASTRYVLVPNGTDHLPAHEGLSGVVRSANELLDGDEMVHGSYPMIAGAVRRELGDRIAALPRLEGEFRSSARSHVLAGVLSARMWLKQSYQECEDLLARYAEPLAAWAHLLRAGNSDPRRGEEDRALLRHAWRLLLQNAPHDSVTGCHVDAVSDDMRARFQRVRQIAGEVVREARREIAHRAAPPDTPSVAVFNPEHGPRRDFCSVRLPLEDGRLPAKLIGPDGSEAPLQLIERGLRSPLDARERGEFGFVAPDVPAFGYRTFRVEHGEPASGPPGADLAIENEYFRVSADAADGTLTLEDRRHGLTLRGLNRFVDGGDRGDEYNYCPPADDTLIGSPSRPPAVRVTERGPARWALEVSQTYSLPASLADGRDGRSAERLDCTIVSRARLYPGVARLDIETEVDNHARDHRLRAHFPTGVRAEHTSAEQHFGVVRRPVALPQEDGTWMEPPIGTYPQRSFVDAGDGSRGLMLANRGLPEYEALAEDGGAVTLALTLLRCVGWLSRGDIRTRRGPAGPSLETPGAQMPGRWTFHYSLIPHGGAAPAGRQGWEPVLAEAHRFARPLQAMRAGGGDGSLPPSAGMLEVEPGSLVLSALKLADDGDGVVARLYNTADAPVEGRIRLAAAGATAETVDLNERNAVPAEEEDGWVKLTLRPNQIVSVRLRTAQE